MASTGQDNLIPFNQLTKEEQRKIAVKGGKASGVARKEKATFKKTLEMLLDEKNEEGKTYRELITAGQIKSAMEGKAENYKLMLELLGEAKLDNNNETPSVNINIIDNSSLESIMYEDNI